MSKLAKILTSTAIILGIIWVSNLSLACDDGGGTVLSPPTVTGTLVDEGDCHYKIKLSWNAVPGATSYLIYNADNDDYLGQTTYTSVYVTNIQPDKQYRFYVKSHGDTGNSEKSNIVMVYAPPCGGAALTPPCNLHASVTDLGDCKYKVNLNWCSVSGATSYTVYNMVGDVLYEIGTVKTNSASITNVEAGESYTFAVTASDGTHNSELSDPVSVTIPQCGGGTPTPPPPTPGPNGWVSTTVSNSNDFQNALNAAANNGKPDEIVLNPGTYNGPFSYDSTNGDNQPLTIKGASGASPSSIIVDGGQKGSTLTITDTNPAHTNSHFTVTGITVQNGKAPSSNNKGGGINVTTPGNISVSSTIVKNNSAGQGGGVSAAPIRTSGGSVIISGNTMSGNAATTGGGGLSISAGGNQVSVSGNTISSNNGGSMGGGVLISIAGTSGTSGGGITISGNSLSSNQASSGGAIAVNSPSSSGVVNIGSNTISSNSASTSGGGISFAGAIQGVLSGNTLNNNRANQGGGGISIATSGQVTAISNTISGNTAPAGGGVMVNGGTTTLVNNIISGNSASSGGGGGVAVSPSASGALVLINNLISGNSAPQGGGVGISTTSSTTGVPAVLINNTIVSNSATSGTGNQVRLVIPTGSSSTTSGIFVNNIIRRTSASTGSTDVAVSLGSTSSGGSGRVPPGFASLYSKATPEGLVVSHNNFFSESVVDLSTSLDSTNTYSDPGFVDAANGDYHLTASSPLRDSGERVDGMGETDFEGDPRVLGSAPDVGADEYIPERIEKLYPPNGAERHYSGDLSQDGLLVFAWYLPKSSSGVAGYNLHLALSYPGGSEVAEGDAFLTTSTGLVVLEEYDIAGWVLSLDETTWNALKGWEIDWSATACTKVNDKTSGVAGTTWGTFTIQ